MTRPRGQDEQFGTIFREIEACFNSSQFAPYITLKVNGSHIKDAQSYFSVISSKRNALQL